MKDKDRLDALTREVEENVPVFTREDLDILPYAAHEIRKAHGGFHVAEELADKLEALADRIEEGLLP